MASLSGPNVPVISVVAPAYRCAAIIPALCARLISSLASVSEDFEIILVNDASPEADWEAITREAARDRRVKGINLSRNFGQHHAITAGIDHTRGQWVVVMDCDLQDRPEEIPRLYHKAVGDGFDIVFGQRVERQDSWFKRACSRGFSHLYSWMSDSRVDPSIGNFSVVSRQVIDEWKRLRECSRSYGLIILWLGFKVGYLPIQHDPRHSGKSAYNFRRALKFAFDSLSAHSNRPLRLSISFGFWMAALSFLMILWILIRYTLYGISVSGWASLIISIYLVGGLLLINMGLIGLYLGKVFDQAKQRPIYVMRETVNVQLPRLDQ